MILYQNGRYHRIGSLLPIVIQHQKGLCQQIGNQKRKDFQYDVDKINYKMNMTSLDYEHFAYI